MLLEFVCLAPSSSFTVGSPMAVGSNSCVYLTPQVVEPLQQDSENM